MAQLAFTRALIRMEPYWLSCSGGTHCRGDTICPQTLKPGQEKCGPPQRYPSGHQSSSLRQMGHTNKTGYGLMRRKRLDK